MSFAKRLTALMTQRGMTAADVAASAGVSRQSVSYWRAGRNEPKADVLTKVATALQTTPLWLKTGEADIVTEPVVVSEDVSARDDFVFVPEYQLEFGCSAGGVDAPIWEPMPEGVAAYRREFFTTRGINPNKCKRVVASGDSMEPFICDGDKVLFVETPEGTPIRDGDVYALSYGGALKIKRLYRKANGDLIIRSDNSNYPDEVVSNDELDDLIRVHGRVIERSGSV